MSEERISNPAVDDVGSGSVRAGFCNHVSEPLTLGYISEPEVITWAWNSQDAPQEISNTCSPEKIAKTRAHEIKTELGTPRQWSRQFDTV